MYPIESFLETTERVWTDSYKPISEAIFSRALGVLEHCEKAVCTLPPFGTFNTAYRKLWETADGTGMQVDWLQTI